MNSVAQLSGMTQLDNPLRDTFLRWQCRVRQIAMRENMGRPDDAITPALTLTGETKPTGHIITVLSKAPPFSKTPELQHMFRRTHDPAQRREKAIQFFAETYYQKAREFSDILTATFPPGSPGAAAISAAGNCTLTFKAYGQRYDLLCKVRTLDKTNPLYQATWWHNMLFNPNMHPDTVIFGFEPDWAHSTAESGT